MGNESVSSQSSQLMIAHGADVDVDVLIPIEIKH